MKFILKSLSNSLSVKGVANVHFFEFPENYSTENDKHPFFELLFVAGGKVKVESANKKTTFTVVLPNQVAV